MSFFGGGGFGQNTNTGTGFGSSGFGTNTNTTGTGFGTGTSGFGQPAQTSTTGGGLFGSGATGTTGGFGSNTAGGFGTGGGFGAKPAFGATPSTTGGGLFGASTTATTGTGFGSTGGFGSNTATTGTGFGTGGGLFGANKPATTTGFGAPATTSGFGATNTGSTSLFGGGGTTSAFGSANNPGIGTNVPDPPGTANVAFAPFQEKEANGSQVSFQNILFMDAYKKWSAEELRLVDYQQGRRYGGQGGTGAFGSSTFGATGGFGTNTATTGGFGTNTATTGGGLFGTGNTGTTGGFGASTTANTGGFGSNTTGGGLFGQQKPATGGLFGSSTTTPATGTGLFGGGGTTGGFGTNTGTTTTGFGANTGTTGGGLFGQQAAKPAGFGFGTTGTTNTGTGFGTGTTGGFGTNTATQNTGGGLFGQPAQQNTATTGGGLFGSAQPAQQQPASTGFGTGFGTQQPATGGGLFGTANQAKPAGGLFGSAPAAAPATGGGLFGNTGATTGFGQANNTATTGGLFGAKPATTTGTGLFGTATAQPAATGGLFGGLGTQQAQQPATGGLFGTANTAAKPAGGLFGSAPAAGGGLFGNAPAQQNTGLFGATNTQQQAGGLGTSLLGGAQNQQQPQTFSAGINDINAYGAAMLFSNLPDNQVQNPGPLATPLNGPAKAKSRSILPMYKLSPANASRMVTPQKRGFGFNYSTFNSPVGTPGGFGQSLLAGSINRGLGKPVSTTNLRRTFNAEDSILTPGAFSANNNNRLLGSSHKKLVINKDMRADLFTSPATKDKLLQDGNTSARKLTKRVSFDTSNVEATQNGAASQQEFHDLEDDSDLGFLKPSSANGRTNGALSGSKAADASPEMEQVKGNELTIVPEETSFVSASSADANKPIQQIEAGSYWMSPKLEEILAMNRVQRQSVVDFTVGRENVGSIRFKVPVDLSNIDVENLYDNIVRLENRSCTVYPNASTKPPVGKGLNVPSLISLEHSYPRGGLRVGGRRLEKHIERLKTITDTTFESYDIPTGVWSFSVEHFTTYGLFDDDEDSEEDEEITEVEPTPRPSAEAVVVKNEYTSPEVDPDDTFEYRHSTTRRAIPGAFDQRAMYDEEELQDADQQGMHSSHPKGADAPLPSREWPDDESMVDGQNAYDEPDAEQSSQSDLNEERYDLALTQIADNTNYVPAGVLRARMRAAKRSTAPTKIEVAGGDDWTQILQASVRAPRTVDRNLLREQNESGEAWEAKESGSPAPREPVVHEGQGFATSIDLMKSLFEQARGPAQTAPPSGGFLKWPYQKSDKVDDEAAAAVAPRATWGPNELLITTANDEASLIPVEGSASASETKTALDKLQQYIELTNANHDVPLNELKELTENDSVWDLAFLLANDDHQLPAFWKKLVAADTERQLREASTPEERAIILLAGNRVSDACDQLVGGKDFRLATLLANIGSNSKDLKTQLEDWKDSNVLSEISEPIRAIYELLSGNACVCAGVKNAPIENRASSFTIAERFNLTWMQSFGLRLFYNSKTADGEFDMAKAINSFQDDIDQDKEPEPESPLWTLLKTFANRDFNWAEADRLGWLLTRSIYFTHLVSFGPDAESKLDQSSVAFASSLTAQGHWVPATFVLLTLSDPVARETAIRDHLGRHAHLIGSFHEPKSPFSALRQFGITESWVWEAKALDFRAKEDHRQEFLALVWAGNYKEANAAFVERVGPDLVIERDWKRLVKFAQLLYKVRSKLGSVQEWERGGAAVYLLYPLKVAALRQKSHAAGEGEDEEEQRRLDRLLVDGLVALGDRLRHVPGATGASDVKREAAVADMAEELIKGKVNGSEMGGTGADARLYGLLPEDVRGRYMRGLALEGMC